VGQDELISIGLVVGAHGMMGEARVYPLTDFPERFAETAKVFLGGRGRVAVIESVRPHGNIWLMKFAGVNSKPEAERLRGLYLMIDQADLHPLPEGTFYTFHLQGCQVISESGEALGVVKNVITGAGNDLIVLERPEQKDAYIPFVREFIKSIDLEAKRVIVSLIPGLVE
jgi:16S rRNA processing protein RimM